MIAGSDDRLDRIEARLDCIMQNLVELMGRKRSSVTTADFKAVREQVEQHEVFWNTLGYRTKGIAAMNQP